MPTIPSIDLALFYQGVGVILVALVALWGVRKVIKLMNRS